MIQNQSHQYVGEGEENIALQHALIKSYNEKEKQDANGGKKAFNPPAERKPPADAQAPMNQQ